jgi:hypothetical protein
MAAICHREDRMAQGRLSLQPATLCSRVNLYKSGLLLEVTNATVKTLHPVEEWSLQSRCKCRLTHKMITVSVLSTDTFSQNLTHRTGLVFLVFNKSLAILLMASTL